MIVLIGPSEVEELDVIIEEESDSEELSEAERLEIPLPLKKIISLILAFLLKLRIMYSLPDRAIVVLLRFFKYLLLAIGTAFNVSALTNGIHFPQSLHGCYTHLNVDESPFREYVACPSCHILYDTPIQELVHGTSAQRVSDRCSFIAWPHHPQQRFRLPCNTILLNQIRTKRGVSFKPRKVYYYYGLKRALSILLSRPNMLKMCNIWLQQRKDRNNLLADIMDGRMWTELSSSLSPNVEPVNLLGLLINVDWFQPYKHVAYSVGVIYAVVINLPRCLRFKDENVVIIGVIPGPHEPKKHINSYIGPLVSELLQLQRGVWFPTPNGKQFIRCVVACLSSDIPATRKVAGFVGHNATKACSRCLKTFPRVNDSLICSGFDRSSWPPRDHSTHCRKARKGLNAKTKADKQRLEREYGARYSVLFELPYYDAIRFAVIDPMHNLFLGTAKHLMSIWKDQEMISKSQFQHIQKKVEMMNIPLDIGRIPYKIESGMASLTADQWKTWTCVYSMYALQGVLPKEHLECWWLFVQACILICQPVISPTVIDRIDTFLLEFCQAVERLYGPQACTINMHLHCHLADCLRDYGPVHASWCFSFERYNGILGATPSNNHPLEIEKTMMKRFIQQMESQRSFPQILDDLNSFFPINTVGSVADSVVDSDTYIKQIQLAETTNLQSLIFDTDLIVPVGQMSQHALSTQEVTFLEQMYHTILPEYKLLHVSRLCYRFSRCKLGSKLVSSQLAKSDRSSYICANWLNSSSSVACRPAYVRYFLKHTLTIERDNKEMVSIQSYLAFVEWYKPHPEREYLQRPVSLWYPDLEPLSIASFMPINRIACRCAQSQAQFEFIERPHNNGQVVIIIPICSTNSLIMTT